LEQHLGPRAVHRSRICPSSGRIRETIRYDPFW
jgi:hypothetical protein